MYIINDSASSSAASIFRLAPRINGEIREMFIENEIYTTFPRHRHQSSTSNIWNEALIREEEITARNRRKWRNRKMKRKWPSSSAHRGSSARKRSHHIFGISSRPSSSAHRPHRNPASASSSIINQSSVHQNQLIIIGKIWPLINQKMFTHQLFHHNESEKITKRNREKWRNQLITEITAGTSRNDNQSPSKWSVFCTSMKSSSSMSHQSIMLASMSLHHRHRRHHRHHIGGIFGVMSSSELAHQK